MNPAAGALRHELAEAFLSGSEAPTVFAGDNERLGHVGFLYSHQNVVTGLGKVIQLAEPEVITRIVRIRSVVRISPQIAGVLHQHKGAIVFVRGECRVLSQRRARL